MPFDARAVDPRIRRAMRILENDQTQTPTAANLSAQVGLSPAHFSRLFAAQIGEASSAYGRRIRLDHSINRLRYDPASIGEVSRDFGYESQAAFTRAFAEQFGMSPRDYMARAAATPAVARAPLPGPVRLVRREPTPLAARRFFGGEMARAWGVFLDDLPAELAEAATFISLSYDDPRVTPPRHQRLDCCVVLSQQWHAGFEMVGFDAIELPGGLHGEVDAVGDPDDLRSLFSGLFAEWLPTKPGLAPEGDPLPIFFEGVPAGARSAARVAIRVRPRVATPMPNAALLDDKSDRVKDWQTEKLFSG